MQEIHHNDKWSAALSRKALCGSVAASGDDLVSQLFIHTGSNDDHITQGDIILLQKRRWFLSLQRFATRSNTRSFLYITIFNGRAVLPLATEVF